MIEEAVGQGQMFTRIQCVTMHFISPVLPKSALSIPVMTDEAIHRRPSGGGEMPRCGLLRPHVRRDLSRSNWLGPCSCDLGGRLTRAGMWVWRGGCLTVVIVAREGTHTLAQWPAAPLWGRWAAEEQKALFSWSTSLCQKHKFQKWMTDRPAPSVSWWLHDARIQANQNW